MTKPLMSATEAAEYSGIGVNTIRLWAQLAQEQKMKFPCFWVGDTLKIPTREFIDWCGKMAAANTNLPTPTVATVTRRR